MAKLTKKILSEVSLSTGHYLLPPEFITLMLTNKCNFRCRSCSIWKNNNTDQLPVDTWTDLTKQIKNNFPANTFIELNGGEALLEPELVLTVIKNLSPKFSSLTLNTNGSLITEDIIKKLTASGLSAIKLSLYSLTPEIHNDLRGSDSAFAKAQQALNLLQSSQLKTEVGVLITRQNIATLPELITHLQQLNKVAIILQSLDESIASEATQNMTANYLPLDLWPDRQQVMMFFDWLTDQRQNIKNSEANLLAIKNYYLNPESTLAYRCFAGQRNLVIYPNGAVVLCFKGTPIGNIKNQSLATIIRSQLARNERRRIAHCQKYCRIIGCNFSRGLKELLPRKIN